MAKRKPDEPPKGAPAWQSTFADLMNLLLCFFVMLFSMSSVDAQKFELLAASFNQTFSIFSAGATAIGDGVLISNGVSQLNELDEYINSTGRDAEGDLVPENLETAAEMMEEAKEMLHEAVEAFVNGDEQAAKDVIAHDDVVDEQFNVMKEKMMHAIIHQDLDADKVVDYLMVAKYLEKIGDHAVNIGEWAIFQLTGDMQGVQLY